MEGGAVHIPYNGYEDIPGDDSRYSMYLSECHDFNTALFIQECEVFELVDFLYRELDRLRLLVASAREKANYIAALYERAPLPFFVIYEDLWDGSFDDHPAMLRYLDLFERADANDRF